MLVDKVKVKVIAGKGGNGCVSFRREKYVPKGGPDGGNGGHGGSVYIKGINNIRLLRKFREKPVIKGFNGIDGSSNKKTGANGRDLEIFAPLGTKITDLETEKSFEILSEKTAVILAKGGKGGRGNWEFRSPTNQAPRQAEDGKPGNVKDYELELMLIADIGLIGLPNAGKSTLLNILTQAHAKTANYPFTTLEPNLGTLDKYIVADIPGLIEGASQGKGLGFQFLKHISRTHLLVHCLSCESTNPKKDYETIKQEIKAYNPKLIEQPEIIVFTKYDLLSESELVKFKKKISKIAKKPLIISVLDDKSINQLAQKIRKKLG